MQIDPETLVDLEFFSCFGTIGQSVFQYLDYFKTDCGRDYVKGLIKNGPCLANEISDLQEITRFFYEMNDGMHLDVSSGLVRDFEAYINTNYIGIDLPVSFSARLQAIYYRFNFSEMFESVKYGIRQTLFLISQVFRYIAGLQQQPDMPDPVKLMCEEFNTICSEINVDKISRKFANPSCHDVYAADYLLRVQNRDNLKKIADIVAKIDGHASMAAATRKERFVFPQILEDGVQKIDIRGLYHPFLAKPVKNDFHQASGSNIWFLTGPNMAGKTTYLKALGISLILAHIGMGVPAESMAFTTLDQLFFQLSVHDDIRLGISSFYREILQVKRVVELLQSGRRLMVIIDEIFKGTNVTDAFDCSKTVINGFARFPDQFFVISSHLYELKPEISGHSNLRCKFFDASLRGDALEFSHTIMDGVSDVRIGTRLLEKAGITGFFNDRLLEAAQE
ncbi:MAG: hypothetical protein A2W80_03980 [Candidatus Riflebacteria bacterium GWC2_50_8]|nr:MAG: hypothetical protein A2W80_03980 [Candidatus Riflebacteria bacterium GWC2_50_8]